MSLKTRDAAKPIAAVGKNYTGCWNRVRARVLAHSMPPRIMASCVVVMASSGVAAVGTLQTLPRPPRACPAFLISVEPRRGSTRSPAG